MTQNYNQKNGKSINEGDILIHFWNSIIIISSVPVKMNLLKLQSKTCRDNINNKYRSLLLALNCMEKMNVKTESKVEVEKRER